MRILPFLVLFACGRGPGPTSDLDPEVAERHEHVLAASAPADDAAFERRIDGVIARQFPAVVTGTELEHVVLTSTFAGEHASQVLVFDVGRQRLVADYRPPDITPWPADPDDRRSVDGFRRALTWPHPHGFRVQSVRGERIVSVVSAAPTSPSNLVLLSPRVGSFEERFVFWNWGHITGVVLEEPWVVAYGYNNSFRSTTWGKEWYSPFIAVFRLNDVLAGGRADAVSPTSEHGDGGGYEVYVVGTSDRRHAFEIESISIQGDMLTATAASGLQYRIELGSRKVELAATLRYKRDLPQREIPDAPSLEGHLEELRKAIKRFPR